MLRIGGGSEEAIRLGFNKSIFIDFAGAKITSDAGFLLMREVDQRFALMSDGCRHLNDDRSDSNEKHSLEQMIRQRVYQMAAGYEDCNDADRLRIDRALRLALGKGHESGASQSMLSRLENDTLGATCGGEGLDAMIIRSADALLKWKNKRRLVSDVDSTADPAHGNQENVAYNGHFRKNCFHPVFCFTSDGDGLAAKLRTGHVFSSDAVLDLIRRIVDRYRKKFNLFWLRGDAGFASPDIYEYCESNRITYFIRIRANSILKNLIRPHLTRSRERPLPSGIEVKYVELDYQARSWKKPRRAVAKIEWHFGELFPRYNFLLTNSRLPGAKVVKVYNGRGNIQNCIKEGKSTLRWDKTSCYRFSANEAGLKMGFLAYNLLHLIWRFYLWGVDRRRSIEWIIMRLIKAGARVAYHGRRWYVHVATAFPLFDHYRSVLVWQR